MGLWADALLGYVDLGTGSKFIFFDEGGGRAFGV